MASAKSIAAKDVPALLRPGMQVYAPGLAGESAVFVQALRAAPDVCAGVRFVGVWLPGVNRVDYAGLHPQAQASAFFVTRDLAGSFASGRVDFRPLSYFAAYTWLRDQADIDLALLHTAPPDAEGNLSLGVANDFTPSILHKARLKVAHVNPLMPRTFGTRVPLAAVDYIVEAPAPLLADDDAPDTVFDAIGRHIAGLIEDGDTLEIGVGRVQRVFSAITGARGLRLHTGAITTPLLPLVRAGGIAEDEGAIVAGVALGQKPLYDFVADNPQVRFAPVGWTHDIRTLSAIERFIAINSVIEVDLLGQANAEMIGGRQVGAAGGLMDFMRGARSSPGGRAIVALPAAAKGGAISKIVAEFPRGSAVSVARGDMDTVVSEFGVADLREKTLDERARALIAIAAPQFRDELTAAWSTRRRTM
ncbi:MAG: acetyl-CoA hydrolase [Rhodospirillales bacterium]|nr:acetyl-CoA hydrolase [Rhodospirillales bacterium]